MLGRLGGELSTMPKTAESAVGALATCLRDSLYLPARERAAWARKPLPPRRYPLPIGISSRPLTPRTKQRAGLRALGGPRRAAAAIETTEVDGSMAFMIALRCPAAL